jgi:hypothetical protein
MTSRPPPGAGGGSGGRWAWAWTPQGTLALLVAWALLHLIVRLALSTALTADDAREAVLAQRWAWGYQARQPPLYNWLVWGAFLLLGPGLWPLTLLKYALLTLGFWLVYLAARRVLADPHHATLATFSFLLMMPISWTVHEALTHSITVIVACAGTAWALLRLLDGGRVAAFAILGLAVGAGVLSKFTYLVFLAALGLAALTVRPLRARLLDARAVVTLLVAGAMVLPYALWFTAQGHDLARLYAREVQLEDGDAWASEAGAGLVFVARMAAYYLVPLGLAFAACFPQVFRRLPAGAEGPPGGRLMGRLLAAVLLLLAGGALGGLFGSLKYRWLIPGFLLAPLYAFWRLERHGGVAGRVRAFVLLLLLAEAGVTGGLALRVLGAGVFARPSRMNEPYDAIADALRAAGFRRGTIVAGFGTLAGNLRVRFPDSRVLHVEYPDFRPPAAASGQCLLVWDRRLGRNTAAAVPDDLRALAAATGIRLSGGEPVRVLVVPFRHDPRHVRRVHFVLLTQGEAGCR